MAEEMETAQNKTSMITLRMYVDLLERIGLGEVRYPEKLPGNEKRAAEELLRSGLVSNGHTRRIQGMLIFSEPLAITPEGISALDSWKMQIKEASWQWKFGGALVRFLWVIVGALAASMSDILKIAFT